MRLELTRSGGVAGLVRPIAIVDTSVLPPERARELERLLQAARFWELPSDITPEQPRPDTFSYELSVHDGTREHAVAFDARSGSPELHELLAAVRAAARTD
jgi:hypothetical protein